MDTQIEITDPDIGLVYSYLLSNKVNWTGIDELQTQFGYSKAHLLAMVRHSKGQIICDDQGDCYKTTAYANINDINEQIKRDTRAIQTLEEHRSGLIDIKNGKLKEDQKIQYEFQRKKKK